MMCESAGCTKVKSLEVKDCLHTKDILTYQNAFQLLYPGLMWRKETVNLYRHIHKSHSTNKGGVTVPVKNNGWQRKPIT